MNLDALTHVTPDGRWFQTKHDASEARLLREMDAGNVDRAIVVALADHIPNDFVLRVCQRHAERLVPGLSFNPAAHTSAPQAARGCRAELRDLPFKVLKLHPRLNRYEPLDPRCLAVLEELSSWNKPPLVWLDTLLYSHDSHLQKPLVDTVHDLVRSFEGLTFVLLHSGGSWVLQLAEAVRDCPNTFLDLSFTMSRYVGSSVASDMAYLLRTFDRRMLFGSDFPEVSIPAALDAFEHLAEGLDREKRNNVLGQNLSKLLGED